MDDAHIYTLPDCITNSWTGGSSVLLKCNKDKGAEKEMSAAQIFSPGCANKLIDSVDAFLFDCDGVLWKGNKLIDGVPETLKMLRSREKRLFFFTNHSAKSRKHCIDKFQSFGISISQDEIFTSTYAAATYLNSVKFPRDKKVYVVGEEGLLQELELAGFTCLGGPEDGNKKVELRPNCLFEHDKTVGAVVIGMDQTFNYYKLVYAALCIRENPGCLFIATEVDPVANLTELQEWPVTGCLVAAVAAVSEKKPVVVGKPSPFMIDIILNKSLIPPTRMCMVGDNLKTDILFGQNVGCKTLLVLTGVTTESTLMDPSNTIKPDYYTNKVSDILELLPDQHSLSR